VVRSPNPPERGIAGRKKKERPGIRSAPFCMTVRRYAEA